MVLRSARALTKVGFRRDVKFFVAALEGFFVIMVLYLLLALQSSLFRLEQSTRDQQNALADLLTRTIAADKAIFGEQLTSLRELYGIAGIDIYRADRDPLRSGFHPASHGRQVTRSEAGQKIEFWFDNTALDRERATFFWIALICITGTVGGTILLLLYLPRIVRPVELLLDQASELGERSADIDETQYLVDVFRSSVERLKQQEAELHRLYEQQKSRADELENVTRTLTRSLTSGFIALDAGGQVVDLNHAAREILRITPTKALSGLSVAEALGTSEFSSLLQSAFEQRLAIARRQITDGDAGEQRTIGLTTVPLFSQEDQFLGVLALFTDLTPVLSLEARVRTMESLADLGEISAGIAHELRNSLGTILGYLKLARRLEISQEVAAKLNHAETEARLLSDAVTGLLSFARPMKLECRPLDLRELMAGMLDRMRATAPEIALDLEGEHVQIDADAPLLSRAFENVIRNAMDAVGQKGGAGQVLVRVSANPPKVVVADNGVGLNPADANRLLLPFQSDKPHGFGLGLALARKIIVLHGGTIQLTGEPGRGATVVIGFAGPPPMPADKAGA